MRISKLSPDLARICENQFHQIGWSKPDGYFLQCFEQQEQGKSDFYVAHDADKYIGHVKLIWNPDYPLFQENGIPEIQDLNVMTSHRRKGVATSLIEHCEDRAARNYSSIGIRVGMYPGYNNAQRIYSKLGYILDGNGASYNNKPVQYGETPAFDDDLLISFTKNL